MARIKTTPIIVQASAGTFGSELISKFKDNIVIIGIVPYYHAP